MKAVIRTLTDVREREAALPVLAALRIEVFLEWPYLYDGTEAYEVEYLTEFISEAGSVLVVAEVDGAIVGAATASPRSRRRWRASCCRRRCGRRPTR